MGWAAIAAALALFVVAGFRFASGTGFYRLYRSSGSASVSYEKARVLEVEREELERDEERSGLVTGVQDLLVRIDTGARAGTELKIQNVLNYTTHFLLKKGDAVVLHIDQADAEHYIASIYSVDRVPLLGLLAALFAVALCGIGGRRGLRSLLGMAFTIACIALVFIPLLYRGCSPVLAASLMAVAVIAVSLLLLAGFSAKAAAAIAGSLAGLAIAAALAFAFESLAQVSGYTTAEADSLLAIAGRTGMKAGELLFAAFLVSTLGAEMDIAISVASAVSEVGDGNPSLGRRALFRAGMNVGRDMMGTMANTLILAFAGTSLNSMILIYSLERSANQILDSNSIVIEIGQSLCAGLAIFLTVPAVAALAALLCARSSPRPAR